MNVLFVCLGNICRSPMVEAMFKQMVDDTGLNGKINVDSVGTNNEEEGNGPHLGVTKTMRAHGLSTDGLISCPITRQNSKWADYIICMDNMNKYNSQRITPVQDRDEAHLAYEVTPGKEDQEILDPWHTHHFEDTYNSLNETLPLRLDKITRELS